jgi:hypothetical protein
MMRVLRALVIGIRSSRPPSPSEIAAPSCDGRGPAQPQEA